MRRAWSVTAIMVAVLVAGCGGGPTLPVNGIVTMDGAPLDGATVTFFPDTAAAGTVGMAQTGSDGKFVITGTNLERGLAPGKYKVTVSKMKIPQRRDGGSPGDPLAVGAVTEADTKDDLPAIYSNASQTILSYSVTGDGKPIEIKLSSKKK